MPYKTCIQCDEMRELELFYMMKNKQEIEIDTCKFCRKLKGREKYTKKIEKLGGSTRVLNQPNKYMDSTQKNQTMEFLKLIGWKFNEEKGIWYKENIKDKDGNFLNLKEHKYTHGSRKYTDEQLFEIFDFFFKHKKNYRLTCHKYKVSTVTLNRYLDIYNKLINKNDKNWGN
jgi:Zn-finger nucleic acid-binding protein